MLNAIKAPLNCFGLSYTKADPKCKACPHTRNCMELMGDRVSRIAVNSVIFDLIPETILHLHPEEQNRDYRDVDAIYCACYHQVFGKKPTDYVGHYREKVFQQAKTCAVTVPVFILVNMFGHAQTNPNTPFMPPMLVDSRAANRIRTYTGACKDKFGTFTTSLLDAIAGSDLADYDLDKRMLTSELRAARWIIDYKLYHPGTPYAMLFTELENELDPAWLAIEPHYARFIKDWSVRKNMPIDRASQATRHEALEIYQRIKKRKYEAIANFRAREKIMPEAVTKAIRERGYLPTDFEIINKPVTDPLNLWNRIAVAMQHLECLLFMNYREGIYAVTPSS